MVESTWLKNGGVIYMKDRSLVAEVVKNCKGYLYKVFVPEIKERSQRHEVTGSMVSMEDAVEVVELILRKVFREEVRKNTGEKKDIKESPRATV